MFANKNRNGKYDAAPVNFYREAKQRYEEVKPIRGRSGDVRPIGKRSRDHECIVKVSDTAYAIRLYKTNVVTYHEDGSIELCTGQYPSVSTAEMIDLHSPFKTIKRNSNVWAWYKIDGKDDVNPTKYLVPADGTSVKFVRRDGRYVPETLQVIQQRVVDRTGIKGLRAQIKPFLDYSKVMLKLSGGWLYINTMLELGGEKKEVYFRGKIIFPKHFTQEQEAMLDNVVSPYVSDRDREGFAIDFVNLVLEADEDQRMRIMYLLLTTFSSEVERNIAFTETYNHLMNNHNVKQDCHYLDRRYTVEQFTDVISKILRQHPQAKTVREIEPGKKFHTNVV